MLISALHTRLPDACPANCGQPANGHRVRRNYIPRRPLKPVDRWFDHNAIVNYKTCTFIYNNKYELICVYYAINTLYVVIIAKAFTNAQLRHKKKETVEINT